MAALGGWNFWDSSSAPGGVGRAFDPLGLFKQDHYRADPVSEQLANLSWSQWQQAANAMYPLSSQLINYAEDPNYIARQRAQALADSNAAFGAQQAAQQRQLGLMGVQPTAAQASAMGRSSALAQAQAQASAMNTATRLAYQNQQAVLAGGA